MQGNTLKSWVTLRAQVGLCLLQGLTLAFGKAMDGTKSKAVAVEAGSIAQGSKAGTEDAHQHSLYQRIYHEENWVHSLTWNVLGYAIVIVPAFVAIRMIRNSNFNEKEGLGFMFNFIQLCVFGTPEKASAEGGQAARTSLIRSSSTNYRVAAKLILCALGLQASYLTWGVLQERIMTQKYGTGSTASRFRDSQFLVFMNRALALLASGIYIVVKRQPNHAAPFYKYSYASLSNILSSWCQYEALKFVSFPTQVLGKTSKMIPVMLMGRLVSKKTYQYYEYVIAVLISIGVSLFLMSVATGKHNSTVTTISGLILMIAYMGFDSFTSNWQSQLFQEYHLSSMQVMFGTNVFSSLFTCISLLQSGGLTSAIQFIYRYPAFGYHALTISLASATGQLFIFYTISTFGPLAFTTIMVTRQMFSILLSCIIYHHSLSPQAIGGVAIVFFALFLQIYAKYRVRQIQQKKGTVQNVV